jgi:DNA-3-methyladenine glycosylase
VALSLQSDELYVADDGYKVDKKLVVASPRIGVDYAGDDALLDYRLYIKGNKFVSGRLK